MKPRHKLRRYYGREDHGPRFDCAVCKHATIGSGVWYCKLHDKYYREKNTKDGRITVAMNTCDGFERGILMCNACRHLKPIRNGGGVLECKLGLNTPIRYEGKKCYEFLPKESEGGKDK